MQVLRPMIVLAGHALLIGAAPKPATVALFDGRTMTGWEQGDSQDFRIEDGALVGGRPDGPIAKKTFLCTTKEYADFRLTARFRLDGNRYANTGIQIRTRRIDGAAATQVAGYQADAGHVYWGTLYDEGRRRVAIADFDQTKVRPHFNDGGWNTYEIVAKGRRITMTLNGVRTVDYLEPDLAIPQSGLICLQLHNGDYMTVAFKDILLTPI